MAKFNVGDKVMTNVNTGKLIRGKEYIVIDPNLFTLARCLAADENHVYVIAEDGQPRGWPSQFFVPFPAPKFKVGDIVRKNGDNNGYKYTIVDIIGEFICFQAINKTYYLEEEYELVPEFKVGDKVKCCGLAGEMEVMKVDQHCCLTLRPTATYQRWSREVSHV